VEITVTIHAEGDGYWSQSDELPGCFASGRTLEELHEALGEAIGLYLWDRPITLRDQPLHVGEARIKIEPPSRI
jgi:predicted RNase H-like HicB family nuclease